MENLYAGCQPVRRNQLLAGFMRNYKSTVTGGSFMEARGERFLNFGAGQPAPVGTTAGAGSDRGCDQADDLRGAVPRRGDGAATAASREAVTRSKRILVIAGPNGEPARPHSPSNSCRTTQTARSSSTPISSRPGSVLSVRIWPPSGPARLMLQQIDEHVRKRRQLRLRDHVEWPRLRAPDPPLAGAGLPSQTVLPAPADAGDGDRPCRPPGLGWRTRRTEPSDCYRILQWMA